MDLIWENTCNFLSSIENQIFNSTKKRLKENIAVLV